MTQTPETAALMGALIADAAALGLHWLYDVDRIAAVADQSQAAFTPIDAAHFKEAKGYFAHGARRDGMLSQYGETLALAMRNLNDQGGFDVAAYQDSYVAHFGPGGGYVGYIDRPTRGTLDNIANGQTNPSGIDDDQHPAISTLPAIVARYHRSPELNDHVAAAIQVSNVNADADRYGLIFANALASVLQGTNLQDALDAAAQAEPLLDAALTTPETDSIAYGAVTQRACHLPQGMPLSFHILKHSSSFEDAVERNVRAGGDSCGRAMMIGALAGAAYGSDAIPGDWMDRLDKRDDLIAQCAGLTSLP
jgi:hypothetical protein